MSKATSKMNKKELIEKIKELEQDKNEHVEMVKQTSQMLINTVEFLQAVKLYPIFLKCMGDPNNRIDLKELKDSINSIKCPECEKGKCGNCEKEKE